MDPLALKSFNSSLQYPFKEDRHLKIKPPNAGYINLFRCQMKTVVALDCWYSQGVKHSSTIALRCAVAAHKDAHTGSSGVDHQESK